MLPDVLKRWRSKAASSITNTSGALSDTVDYKFFFSYSRADWDVFLDRFFRDLEREVAGKSGAGERKVGFRDEEGIRTGDDWNSKISAAVQISNVLVCVYSPNFFARDRMHEFCAKEFMAFLKRNPEHRYELVVEQGQHRYQWRGARNILPVLWFSESDLVELNDLPPHAVRSIQYTLNFSGEESNLNKRYKEKGMSRISTRRGPGYRDIIDHLAKQIVVLSANPLPRMTSPPDIRTLRNAFWDPPDDMPSDPLGGGAEALAEPAAITLHGSKQIVAFEVRNGSSDASNWTPYAGELSLRALIEEIAQARRLAYGYRQFDPGAVDFIPEILSSLADATKQCVRPILFVDPKCLAREEWRTAVVSLLRYEWRGGIIIPVDSSDKTSVRLVDQAQSEFQTSPNEREWIIVRISKGRVTEFRTAVISVVDEILARIVEHGAVQRNYPAESGPSTLPRIANTLDRGRVQ
jgi:hypothetical protein